MTFTTELRDRIRPGVQASAAVVVPLLRGMFPEASRVVDVGCGEGWFAKEFEDRGCEVVGLDSFGTNYVGREFVPWDLEEAIPVGSPGDLAICLEVGEHLSEARAEGLVSDLCALAPVVVFSAAIPGQTGPGHINCQWQSWWAALFAQHGRTPLDFRALVWDDDRVEPWYRQNVLVYTDATRAWRIPPMPLDVVHPAIYGWKL